MPRLLPVCALAAALAACTLQPPAPRPLAPGEAVSYMARQHDALLRILLAERARGDVAVTRAEDRGLRLALATDAFFGPDDANLRPQMRPTVAKLAEVLRRYERTVVRVLGHGGEGRRPGYARALAERRAAALARALVARGVTSGRIVAGAGEGTGRGRRGGWIEILILPLVRDRPAAP